MEGTVVTAWFHAEPSALAKLAHPDFPPASDGRQARIRFYQIEAQADGRSVPFREAVVAYKTEFSGVKGELSALMWTDSLPYLAWGREVFGWPLQLGDVQLVSGLWGGDRASSADCRIGDLSLTSVLIGEELAGNTSGPPIWITPHRVVDAIDPQAETRRVYAVRPRVMKPGRIFRCSGVLDVRSLLGEVVDAEIDLVTDFRIEVGADVKEIE
jgi:hypothetical protein